MRCPNCSHNQKVKDGLTCGSCRYAFAFNPKETSPLGVTDGKFLACIRNASQNDATYFTLNQLYAACCRKLSGGMIEKMIGGVLSWVGINTGLGKLSREQFDKLVEQWRAGGKQINSN